MTNPSRWTRAFGRLTWLSRALLSAHGRINPARVICAEPSPDVAVTFANAVALAAKADVAKGPFAASGGLTSALSSVGQAFQLAERTGAIQAIREVMYRACEAYSNGGISEIQYALLLSKLSETLVSLRYGELAAGDFGRSLGGSTGTADSESSATGSAEGRATRELLRQANLRTEEKNNQVREAERDLQQARRENRELQNSLSQKQQEIDRTQSDLRTADAARAPVLERQLSDLRKESREIDNKLKEKSKDVSELERKLERAESEQRRSLDEARTAQSLAARSRAGGTVTVGGGLDRSPSSELAREIKEMQRDFLRDDGSVDAIIATCSIALSNQAMYQKLAESCSSEGLFGGLIKTLVASKAAYQQNKSNNINEEQLAKIEASKERAKADLEKHRAGQERAKADAEEAKTAQAKERTAQERAKVEQEKFKADQERLKTIAADNEAQRASEDEARARIQTLKTKRCAELLGKANTKEEIAAATAACKVLSEG